MPLGSAAQVQHLCNACHNELPARRCGGWHPRGDVVLYMSSGVIVICRARDGEQPRGQVRQIGCEALTAASSHAAQP